MYLRATGLVKSFGDNLILAGASLLVNGGERVGLVGSNGCGKTTLLRILAGLDRPDSGAVEVSPPTARVGYLPQSLDPTGGATVADALGPAGLAWALRPAIAAAADDLARAPASPEALASYAHLWERFDSAGGYLAAEHVEDALRGLGLAGLAPDTTLSTLSGGTRTRVALAGLLAAQPDCLLLDEPTNYLDLPALEWLEEFVANYSGAVLVVSHDRTFLDRVVSRIVELDPATGQLASYAGGYTAYVAAKARELEARWEAYERQQERVAEVEANIRAAESRARGIEQTTVNFYWRARARKVARAMVVRKRRLERELDREGRVEKPVAGWQMLADFAPPAESGRDVLVVENLAVDYGERRVLAGLSLRVRRGERVVVTGANGSGKTTLLRAIVGELPPTVGTIRLGAGVRPGYLAQGPQDLDPAATPLEIVRSAAPLDETEARRFLHRFLFAGDEAFTLAGRLSYGERARLLLARLVLSGANLLLLDEPLSHLDLPSRERFEAALLEFGGTLVAVLHDRYAIARLATRALRLEDGKLVDA